MTWSSATCLGAEALVCHVLNVGPAASVRLVRDDPALVAEPEAAERLFFRGNPNLARPGIADALDRLRRAEAGVLVVSKLDRLSRSLLDFAGLMDRAKREGWRLVVLDLAIDTTTASGALMANVMASFAEYERRLISDRTSAALQAKKAQGARLGRPRTTPEAVVNRVVQEREQGRSLRAIADGLNRDGITSAQGGKQWYASTVVGLLRSQELDALADAIGVPA